MSMVRLETHVSPDDLLKAIGQLSPPELEGFLTQVLYLRARRKATSLPQHEAELLLKINQGIPNHIRPRYKELKEKRDEEILSIEEHQELLNLVTEVERIQAQRLEALAELARLRKITVRNLMNQLEIVVPHHA